MRLEASVVALLLLLLRLLPVGVKGWLNEASRLRELLLRLLKPTHLHREAWVGGRRGGMSVRRKDEGTRTKDP